MAVLDNSDRRRREVGEAADPLGDLLRDDWGMAFDDDIVIDLNSPQPTTAQRDMLR